MELREKSDGLGLVALAAKPVRDTSRTTFPSLSQRRISRSQEAFLEVEHLRRFEQYTASSRAAPAQFIFESIHLSPTDPFPSLSHTAFDPSPHVRILEAVLA